jgi:hypothetical protein
VAQPYRVLLRRLCGAVERIVIKHIVIERSAVRSIVVERIAVRCIAVGRIGAESGIFKEGVEILGH